MIKLDKAFAIAGDGRVDALWRGNEVLKAKATTKLKYPSLYASKIILPEIHIRSSRLFHLDNSKQLVSGEVTKFQTTIACFVFVPNNTNSITCNICSTCKKI